MLAVRAPTASLSRPAARGSPGGPRRASPSVAFGGANVRFPARSPAVRFATRWDARVRCGRRPAGNASGSRERRRRPFIAGLGDASVGGKRSRSFESRVHSLRLHRRVEHVRLRARHGSVASALVFLEDASSAAALTTSAKARLVAATPLGVVLGALAAPRAADTRGRKRTLLDVAGAAYALGGASLLLRADRPEPPPGASAPSGARPGRGRAGVSTSVTTMYVSECAPARVRGSAASVCPLSRRRRRRRRVPGRRRSGRARRRGGGVAGDGVAVRALGSCLVPVLAQTAMRDCLVESPRWLLARRGPSEARAAAGRLWGTVEAELFLADVGKRSA